MEPHTWQQLLSPLVSVLWLTLVTLMTQSICLCVYAV